MASKTVVGRLGGVPEVRAAGTKHVAVFSVAETKRKFDRATNEWVDDFTLWHECESWQATNAIGQLAKGTLVIIEAEERDGSYTSRESGQTVRKVKLNVRTIGVVVQEPRGGFTAAGDGWSTSEEPF